MAYYDYYQSTDELLEHLKPLVFDFDDQTKTKYAGFLAVTAVTVFELAIKEVFVDFAVKKSKVFGDYVGSTFGRINGRIKISDLNDYTKRFGERYNAKFQKLINQKDSEIVAGRKGYDLKNAYNSLLQCRHDFVHKNQSQLTFDDVVLRYIIGKNVVDCLYNAMKR